MKKILIFNHYDFKLHKIYLFMFILKCSNLGSTFSQINKNKFKTYIMLKTLKIQDRVNNKILDLKSSWSMPIF